MVDGNEYMMHALEDPHGVHGLLCEIDGLKKQKQIAYDELNNICKCGMCNEALDAIQRALFILEEKDDD